MHIFGYAEQHDEFKMSEEWLQEQQSKFNFARYSEIDLEKLGQFMRFNEDAMNQVLSHSEPRVYICNQDKNKAELVLPPQIDISMDISLKEV